MKALHSRVMALTCAACPGATLVVTASARQSGPGSEYLPVFNEPHPFVIGNATIQRYLTMVRECAQAGLATSR